MDSVRNMNVKSSALAKHMRYTHPEVDVDIIDLYTLFEASLIASDFRHNVTRYVSESLVINESNNDPNVCLMNGRTEWGNNRVRRLRAT